MLNQVLPKIECESITQNYGKFAIGPMARGYGVTIGIALRRVLLSSLSGAAITSLRVVGITHEFTEIPGAKEDMTLLILNLKKVRPVSYSDEPVRLRVSAKGKSIITAGDIECPSDVEIMNPELQLLTLDTLDSDLDIELIVEKGVGYSPADDRKGLPIGQIPIDAIYSPIIKVNHDIEPARIEQITDYDLLKLEIWTDGTMRPGEALVGAASRLIQHFSPVSDYIETESEQLMPLEEEADTSELYEVPIEQLGLSMRAFNCLKRAGIASVGDIMDRLARGANEMLAIRNFGRKSLDELLLQLKEKGYLAQDFELDE